VDLFKWYGLAALPEYLKTQKKIQKIENSISSIGDYSYPTDA